MLWRMFDFCTATAKLCVLDSVIRLRVPEPIEWRRIGNQIKAAFIFARAYFNRNPRAIVTFS
jgi:hypothetical protein